MNQSLTYEFEAVVPAVAEDGLFSRTCTFSESTGATNSMGQYNETQVPVAGLENVPCMFGVSRDSPQFLPTEGRRTKDSNEEFPEFHLLLNGYYPAVLPKFTVQLDGDSTVYEITPGTVQHDSQHVMTRCKLRRFSY